MADEKRLNPISDVLASEIAGLRQDREKPKYDNGALPPAEKVRAIGEAVGFVSRDGAAAKEGETRTEGEVRKQYRWTTGRNRTTTIRASNETIDLLDKVATKLKLQKGVVLERALAAFIRETGVNVND
jgi:hypothetical protein